MGINILSVFLNNGKVCKDMICMYLLVFIKIGDGFRFFKYNIESCYYLFDWS